jgi:hypothetical protein
MRVLLSAAALTPGAAGSGCSVTQSMLQRNIGLNRKL